MASRPSVPTFQNLFNLRDLGGIPTTTGQHVIAGRLFRSDGAHRATEADRAMLSRLTIRTIIDLRSHKEIDRFGSFAQPLPTQDSDSPGQMLDGESGDMAVDFRHHPILDELWTREMLITHPDPVDFLIARYLELAHARVDQIRMIMSIVAETPHHGVLFHCSAGKDRTGVIAAMILSTIGVSDDEIAKDYALTSLNMPALLNWISANSSTGPDNMVEQPAQFLQCPPEAMSGFLAALRTDYGSIDSYLESIGVTRVVIEQLQTNLVA